MNELDVLRRWDPATGGVAELADQEAAARARLDAAMGAATVARRPFTTAPRRFVGRALLATVVTAALVVGGVVVLRRTLDDAADRVHRVQVGAGTLDHPADGAPMNILVVGSDSRAFVSNRREADAFGTPQEQAGQRSDTMILVHIDGDHATAVWLPRDLLVPDGHGGRVELNAVLDAGPGALVPAVRAATGEPVDHYVEADFAGFVKVVDALGGVRVFVPAPMRDSFSGLDLTTPGCTTLHGDAALAWVRSRHAEYLQDGRWVDASPRADLDRIARQQLLVQSIGTHLRARVGNDLGLARRLLGRVFASLTVDATMDRDAIESFAAHVVRPGGLQLATAPTEPDVEPGRLHLRDRPPGEDFFTWATRPAPNGTVPATAPAPSAAQAPTC
jgi:LCP family protein required for cell wall assembly